MPLPNEVWSTLYPAQQDTGTNAVDQQGNLQNDSSPGADDGHRVLAEHLLTLRNKVQALALKVGDDSNLPAGSILDQLTAGAWDDAVRVSSYSNSLSTAVGAIGSNAKKLYVDVDTTVSSNLTVPANIELIVLGGNQITINAGITLTVSNQVIAGLYKIFAGTGTAAVNGIAKPEWWGATGNGVTDDSSAINSALAQMTSGFLQFRATTYKCQSLVGKSNVGLLLDPLTTISAIDGAGGNILSLDELNNITIIGNGGKFEGTGGGSLRTNISITGSTSIRIYDLVSNNGGTGFYIDGAIDATPTESTDIWLVNCKASGNLDDDDLVVVSVSNLSIRDCDFTNVTSSQVSGDLEILDSAKGVILKSPNGTRYRLTVENNGDLTTTVV